jgi:hypothetical protein
LLKIGKRDRRDASSSGRRSNLVLNQSMQGIPQPLILPALERASKT